MTQHLSQSFSHRQVCSWSLFCPTDPWVLGPSQLQPRRPSPRWSCELRQRTCSHRRLAVSPPPPCIQVEAPAALQVSAGPACLARVCVPVDPWAPHGGSGCSVVRCPGYCNGQSVFAFPRAWVIKLCMWWSPPNSVLVPCKD